MWKLVRLVLGKIILFQEFLTTPKGIVRNQVEQDIVDAKTESYQMYQYEACPFCVKVRKTINKHSLNIEYLDAKRGSSHRDVLEIQGGKVKVPCLRLLDENGDEQWLYESSAIIEHLEDLVTTEVAVA